MKFTKWLTEVGDTEAARILRVTPRAARSWRSQERRPKPAKAVDIAKRLKGKVSFAEIYE
jgi:DNA-binding transcriptional regulator YdaS (Cro superfamily)